MFIGFSVFRGASKRPFQINATIYNVYLTSIIKPLCQSLNKHYEILPFHFQKQMP
jgi:hypothetical protein